MTKKTPDLSIEKSTRATIFKVAARLFAEKGFNGVSVREISEQSRVTKPTIYYYFGNKEGLYKALIEEGLAYHTEDLKQIAALEIPVKEKLTELMKRRFAISKKHPELTKFVIKLFTPSENLPFLDAYKPQAALHKTILEQIIQQGINSGEFGSSARPELAVHVIAGVLMHFLARQLNREKDFLSDRLAEEIVDLLFKGLNE